MTPPPTMPAPRGGLWLRILPFAALVCLTLVVLVSGIWREISLDRLLASRDWLHDSVAQNRPRALAVAVLVYVSAVIVSVPASLVLTMIYGFLFGTLTGALTAVCSATTGAMIVFSIGRYAARDLILRRAGSWLGRFAEGFRRDAFGYVAFLRLLPIFPFWMTNLVPAAFGVRLRTFVLATFLGLLPGAFIYASLGAGVNDLAAAHAHAKALCLATNGTNCEEAIDLHGLITPTTIASLVGLALLALFSVGIRRQLERRTRPD